MDNKNKFEIVSKLPKQNKEKFTEEDRSLWENNFQTSNVFWQFEDSLVLWPCEFEVTIEILVVSLGIPHPDSSSFIRSQF